MNSIGKILEASLQLKGSYDSTVQNLCTFYNLAGPETLISCSFLKTGEGGGGRLKDTRWQP